MIHREVVRQLAMTYLCEVARVQMAPIHEVADHIETQLGVKAYRMVYGLASRDSHFVLIQGRQGPLIRIR